MRKVGVWERNEGLKRVLIEELQKRNLPRPTFFSGEHPANLAGESLDLLVVSPQATGWAGAATVNCRLVLLPGSAAALTRGMKVEGAVSYGNGPKNTITLSSLEEGKIGIAIQRELVTVEGGVVERQELVLPYRQEDGSPEFFMARVGALLLLGLTPE